MRAPRLRRFAPRAVCVVAAIALAPWTVAEVVINLDEPPATKPSAPKTSAKPDATAPSKKTGPGSSAKHDDTPGKIDGLVIPRGDRGFIGLKIEGGVFKMTFYNHDKKPVAPDVTQAVLRWPVNYQPNNERTLLTPGSDGKSLTSAKVIRPPYSFKLFITLLKGDATPAEEHVVDFRQ